MVNPIQHKQSNQTLDKPSKQRPLNRQPTVVVATFLSTIKWELQQTVAPKASGELQTPRTQGVFDLDETAHPHAYRAVPRSRPVSVHRPRDLPPSSFIVLPSAYLDANEWSMTDRTPPTLINHDEVDLQNVYHSETRLPDGRPSLLIDPGSVANLCGDRWAQECAKMAIQHGLAPSQNKRARPLSVMGVGNGNQTRTQDCTLPIAMSRENDTTVTGSFTNPVVAESELPGLLGFRTMRNNRAVLDMVNLQLHFCGPAYVYQSDTSTWNGIVPVRNFIKRTLRSPVYKL